MLLRGRCYERVKIYTKNPTRSPQTASKQYQSQKQGRTDVANRGEGETTSHGNNSPSAASFFFTPLSHVRRSNRRKQGAEKCGTPEDFFFLPQNAVAQATQRHSVGAGDGPGDGSGAGSNTGVLLVL